MIKQPKYSKKLEDWSKEHLGKDPEPLEMQPNLGKEKKC